MAVRPFKGVIFSRWESCQGRKANERQAVGWADKTFYELRNRKSLFNIGVIFVAVVMESDKVTIIFVNSGGGNNGTP